MQYVLLVGRDIKGIFSMIWQYEAFYTACTYILPSSFSEQLYILGFIRRIEQGA